MIHYVLLAGFSDRYHDELRNRLGPLQRQFREVTFVSAPLRNQTYDRGYALSLEARLAKASESSDERSGLLVTYVDHGPAAQPIVDTFCNVGVLARVLMPNREAQAYQAEAAMVNKWVKEIGRVYGRFRENVAAVRDQVVNKRNKTPLLLPLDNFASEHLDTLLRETSTTLTEAETLGTATSSLEQLISNFQHHHPFVQVEGEGSRKGKRAFRNSQEIEFVAPGNDLHGQLALQDNTHRSSCVIASRFRTGHGYHHAFHYDCNFPRKASRTIPSCHGEFDRPGKTTHANIAPNDFARKAG